MTAEWSDRFAWMIAIGGVLALTPIVSGIVWNLRRLAEGIRARRAVGDDPDGEGEG